MVIPHIVTFCWSAAAVWRRSWEYRYLVQICRNGLRLRSWESEKLKYLGNVSPRRAFHNVGTWTSPLTAALGTQWLTCAATAMALCHKTKEFPSSALFCQPPISLFLITDINLHANLPKSSFYWDILYYRHHTLGRLTQRRYNLSCKLTRNDGPTSQLLLCGRKPAKRDSNKGLPSLQVPCGQFVHPNLSNFFEPIEAVRKVHRTLCDEIIELGKRVPGIPQCFNSEVTRLVMMKTWAAMLCLRTTYRTV